MKKYNLLYWKNSMTLCAFGTLFVVIPFLIASLCSDALPVAEEIALNAVTILGPPTAVTLYCGIRALRVRHIVQIQEKLYMLPFDIQDAPLLSKGAMSPIFATEEVLIVSGKLILHKAFIRSWETVVRHNARGDTHHLRFTCKNNKKYTVFLPHTQCAVFLPDTDDLAIVTDWLNT